jgi:3-oxoacyl-(acyl-carrier-protein) synthase
MSEVTANASRFEARVRAMAMCSAGAATAQGLVTHIAEGHSALTMLQHSRFIRGDFLVGEVPAIGALRDRPRRMLECALQPALDAAGLSIDERGRTGVFVGTTGGFLAESEMLIYDAALQGLDAEERIRQNLISPSVGEVATLAAQIAGVSGPVQTYSMACTSSAFALFEAWKYLRLGLIDHAIVIGYETLLNMTVHGFRSLMLYSPDQPRPFDRRRNGLQLGEGCAVMVLDRATADDGEFYLCGGASRNDHINITGTNMAGDHVLKLMGSMLDVSQIHPHEVVAIKAHGTGTLDNDVGEGRGYRRFFSVVPPFSSLKAYFGHTLGAGGVMEAVAWLECLRRGFIPASHGFSEMDEDIGVAPLTRHQDARSGFYAMTHFGFGGSSVGVLFRFRATPKRPCGELRQ